MSDTSDRKDSTSPDNKFKRADDTFRHYNESRRPLHRARVERALTDARKLLDRENNDRHTRKDVESAIEHLERLSECLADESLPCSTAEALETEDWLVYDELRYQHAVSGNMPMLLEAFVISVQNGVSPGQWIVGPLAEAFDRILDDPDASQVANRLGLQGQGSGSASPLRAYSRQIEAARINIDMKTLVEEFGVSQMNAANALIERDGLEVHPKTLVNRYESRTKFPDLVRQLLDEHMSVVGESTVWLADYAAQEFLDSFPPSAQKYLKFAHPHKT